MQKLKLIKDQEYEGYLLDNVKEVLGPKKFEEFEKWIYGQTVGEYEGKTLIYRIDLERFLKDLPVVD
jgi:hypothetical protein